MVELQSMKYIICGFFTELFTIIKNIRSLLWFKFKKVLKTFV
jgi:hypothetical protein